MFRRILASSRYLIIIAVLATFLAAVALLVYGGLTVLHVIYEMFASSQFTTTEAKHFSVEFIEIIDLFLLGTVLYIVSLGLYELFIDERIVMPHWLVITDLDDLKGKLLGVITVLHLRSPESPRLSSLTFTHIFRKSLDKGITKAEVISISTMTIVLPGSFIKSVCKMWVKDSLSSGG